MKKKRSTYDPILLSEKYNISIEEAEKIVNDRKKRTAGTLDNFIRRHGPVEGPRKFEEFRNKSKHTLNTFIHKYGDDGKIKYEEYLKSKDSRSDTYFLNKYGNGWESKKKEFIDSWSHKMSLSGFIDKYGEFGQEEFYKMNKKKAHTLETFIDKYGETEGKVKYIEYTLSKDSTSLEYHIKKYGEIEGKIKYEDKVMKISPIYIELCKIYGKDVGEIRYKMYLQDKKSIEFNGVVNKIKPKWFKCNKNPVSKSSTIFFDILKDMLNVEMSYGKRKDELVLFDGVNSRKYYYDCYIPSSNIIIEYNGSAFHYHPTFGDDWVSIYGVSPKESERKDQQKIKFAEDMGYRIFTVWDFEVSTKNKMYNKVEEIVNECRKTMV